MVGAEAAGIMSLLHQREWNFFLASILGMAAAMVVQMLMAFAASPLLGSIETMAPSMVVAMGVPIFMDAGELAGWTMGRVDAGLLGAALGVTYFLHLECYGTVYKRRLARRWRQRSFVE